VVEIVADAAVSLSGDVEASAVTASVIGGSVSITACDVALAAGAEIESAGDGGDNEIIGRGAISLESGSEMRADATTGSNHIIYGDPDLPPRIAGTVVPAAAITLNDNLGPCAGAPSTTVPTTVLTTTTHMTTTSVFRPANCGDGIVDGAEECDGGGDLWRIGVACRFNCTRLDCGDPDDSGRLTASDALFLLRGAVGIVDCASCICDVDQTGGGPKAGDALRVLRVAVGHALELACPLVCS
jgi:hypothetical protein